MLKSAKPQVGLLYLIFNQWLQIIMCVSKNNIIVASKYRKMFTLVHRLKYPIFKNNWFAFKIKNKGYKSNLLHFLISNFPLISQLLIYSTWGFSLSLSLSLSPLSLYYNYKLFK